MAPYQKSLVKSIHGNSIVAVGILLSTCSCSRQLNATRDLCVQGEQGQNEQNIYRPSSSSYFTGGYNLGIMDRKGSWRKDKASVPWGERREAKEIIDRLKKEWTEAVDLHLTKCPANNGEVAAGSIRRTRSSLMSRSLSFNGSELSRSRSATWSGAPRTLYVLGDFYGPEAMTNLQGHVDKDYILTKSKDQTIVCDAYDRMEVLVAFTYSRADNQDCAIQFESFYHGTKYEFAMDIVKGGLRDLRQNLNESEKDKGLMVGNGFYLTKSVAKADQYARLSDVELHGDIKTRVLTILKFDVARYIQENAVQVLAWRSLDPNKTDEYSAVIWKVGNEVYEPSDTSLIQGKSKLLKIIREKYDGRLIHVLARNSDNWHVYTTFEDKYSDVAKRRGLVELFDEYVVPVTLMKQARQAHIRPSVLIDYRRCKCNANWQECKDVMATCKG